MTQDVDRFHGLEETQKEGFGRGGGSLSSIYDISEELKDYEETINLDIHRTAAELMNEPFFLPPTT